MLFVEVDRTRKGEMLERVAETLFFAGLGHNPLFGESVPEDELTALRDATRNMRMDTARMVLNAMREPTDAMLEAVVKVPEHLIAEHGEHARAPFEAATIADRMVVRQHWLSLIDAALKG